MAASELLVGGYVCTPYLHNHESIEIKDTWQRSKNIQEMYFATATFSKDGGPYFSPAANHYIIAKFKDNTKILKEIDKFKQEKASFIFSMNDELFERECSENVNFVSVYYLEYGESYTDMQDVADVIAKRDKVGRAGIGTMDLCSNKEPKFTFPYRDSIVVLEVASDKSHQSVNKYCEETRRHICRKGITLTNLVSLSVLEKLK